MTKYDCGHEASEVFLDANEMSYIGYQDWAETIGVFGTKEKCFNCYCQEINERRKKKVQ